jgi:hypothetical protein
VINYDLVYTPFKERDMSECEYGNQPCGGIEATQANIAKNVKDGYWGIVGVPDANPPFYYSVGLDHHAAPDIILIGSIPPQSAMGLINTAGEYIMENELDQFDVQTPYDQIANLPTAFIDISEEAKREYCVQAFNHYGNWDFQVQQLVWPDREGLFPWDVDNAFLEGGEFFNAQPLLNE